MSNPRLRALASNASSNDAASARDMVVCSTTPAIAKARSDPARKENVSRCRMDFKVLVRARGVGAVRRIPLFSVFILDLPPGWLSRIGHFGGAVMFA